MTTQQLTPFLIFTGQAQEAMDFYVSLFWDGEVLQLEHFPSDGPGHGTTVKRAKIRVGGQTLMCFDSPVKHAFGFTPAISLFVECETEADVDRLSSALADGGSVLMPTGTYDFSRRFGWVNDRYGVSWQLNLA